MKYHIRVHKNGNLYASMGDLFPEDFLVQVRYVAVGDLLVLNEQGFIVDVVPSYAVKKNKL